MSAFFRPTSASSSATSTPSRTQSIELSDRLESSSSSSSSSSTPPPRNQSTVLSLEEDFVRIPPTKQFVNNSNNDFSLDQQSSVFQQENPLVARSAPRTVSRCAPQQRQPSIVFENKQALVEEEGGVEDDDYFNEYSSGPSPPPLPRTASGADASRSSSASDEDPSSFNHLLPEDIRVATPYVVILLIIQCLTVSLLIGAIFAPQLPKNYYISTTNIEGNSNITSICSVRREENGVVRNIDVGIEVSGPLRPLQSQPYVYVLLSDSGTPVVILTLAVIMLSNPRGRTLHFECISAVLASIHFVGNASLPNATPGTRAGYILGFLIFLHFLRVGFRCRQAFAALPQTELAEIVLEKIPATLSTVAVSLLFILSDSVGCIVENSREPRLCDDKAFSNAAVSVLLVIVAITYMYDFQVFFVFAFTECCLALYLYSSASTVLCFDDYSRDGAGKYGSYLSRMSIRFVFHGLWMFLFASISSKSPFIERTTEWEKRLRTFLLSKKPAEYAPILSIGLVLAITFLFKEAFGFVYSTMKLLSTAEPHDGEYAYLVFSLNVKYINTKFTRLMIHLLGAIYFMAYPKKRHRMRFLWGCAIPIAHSLVVLLAVLMNPKIRNSEEDRVECYGRQEHTLHDWKGEQFLSVLFLVVPVCSLLSQNKARTYLGLEPDTDIQLHFQRSLQIFFAKLPPMIYLLGDIYGCMASSKSVETCSMLSDCNFLIMVYLTLSSIFYLYFNHAQDHYEPKDYLNFRGVDSFTALSFLWEGAACAISFCCFGMRPKHRDLVINADDCTALSELTGNEKGEMTVLRRYVYAFTSIIVSGYVGISFFGFFSLRHAEVLIRAKLSGGIVDVDEVLSSSTARCCSTFEKRTEKVLKIISVHEDEISVSRLYKVCLAGVIYLAPFAYLAGFVFLAMEGAQNFHIGVLLLASGAIANPIGSLSSMWYIYFDLKNDLSTWTAIFIVLVPGVAQTTVLLYVLIKQEYATVPVYSAYVFAYVGIAYIINRKRNIMITQTTPAWRRQKLVQIATGLCSATPTILFLIYENFACAAQATVNTPALRKQKIDPGETFLRNAVEEECGSQFMQSIPMILCCAYFTTIQCTTYRKNRITTAQVVTLQLPFLDFCENLFSFVLVCSSITMFCFRNRKGSFSYNAVRGWIFLLLLHMMALYFRDKSNANKTANHLLDLQVEVLPPTRRLTAVGVSTRTNARRSIVQLGREDLVQRGMLSPKLKSGSRSGSASDEVHTTAFVISPGLM